MSELNKITVIIADDHKLVREGLKQLLELEDDISVIDQAGDGKEAIEKLEVCPWYTPSGYKHAPD